MATDAMQLLQASELVQKARGLKRASGLWLLVVAYSQQQ